MIACYLCGKPDADYDREHGCDWSLVCGAPLANHHPSPRLVWWANVGRCRLRPTCSDGRCAIHSTDIAAVDRRREVARRRGRSVALRAGSERELTLLPVELLNWPYRHVRSLAQVAPAIAAVGAPR